jgi:hypothetical protein
VAVQVRHGAVLDVAAGEVEVAEVQDRAAGVVQPGRLVGDEEAAGLPVGRHDRHSVLVRQGAECAFQ